jgi:hypothetical protein
MPTLEASRPEPDMPATMLETAFYGLFDALVTNSVEDMRWAGHVIGAHAGISMHNASKKALCLEDAILSSPTTAVSRARLQEARETTLLSTIRAYEYSGVTVNGDYLLTITHLCGQNKKWLRGVVKPNNMLFKEAYGIESRKARRELKARGMQTMDALGLISRFKKPFIRLGTST